MQKILLYYRFYPLSDPAAVKMWQKALCESLNLKGRILVSTQGINGTIGGEVAYLKKYIKQTKQYQGFHDIVFKWSDGQREDFPRLSVKVRRELVGFHNEADAIEVDQSGVVGGGQRLKPHEVNQLVEKYGDDVVFFDGRNAHEAKIGKFRNAVVPETNTSRDFVHELDSDKYDAIKDKKVIAYCTGGIRCEIITAMMKRRGFKDVYQIDGGIAKYGETYGDDGLWEGSLRVFDNRKTMDFGDHAKVLDHCIHCGQPTSNFENCADKTCNEFVLICKDCFAKPELRFHTAKCRAHARLATT